MGWGVGKREGWVEGGEGEGREWQMGAEWRKGGGGGDRGRCGPHP